MTLNNQTDYSIRFLEDFPPGMSFIGISIAIRVVHAAGNAGTITSTFTYTAVEFPNSVAKIFVSFNFNFLFFLYLSFEK